MAEPCKEQNNSFPIQWNPFNTKSVEPQVQFVLSGLCVIRCFQHTKLIKRAWIPLCVIRGFVLVCIKGALDKFNIIPQLLPKKVGIFVPLEVLAWVMTACGVLHSRSTYFWRNMNISSFFYFSKSTSINTQYSSLWDTLKMMLITKYLIKWKRIGRISWNFWYWFDCQSSIELDIKKC